MIAKNPRRILTLASVAALILAALALSGCAPTGDSIRDIINDFTGAINARNAGDIKDILDSDAESYSQASTMSFWDAWFPSGSAPYSITSFTSASNWASVEFKGANGSPTLDFYFEMTEVKGSLSKGGTYEIRRVYLGKLPTGEPFFK